MNEGFSAQEAEDLINNIYSGIKNMDDALNDLYNTINE